jgi:hypothetical protein
MLSFRDSEAGNMNCSMTELKKEQTVAEIPQSSISPIYILQKCGAGLQGPWRQNYANLDSATPAMFRFLWTA